MVIGAEHATPVISETTLINGRQAINRLIIFFKILKFMHGIISWYWNGIRGQPFQILKKLEKVVMQPFFVLKPKLEASLNGITKGNNGVVMELLMMKILH